MKILIVEDEPSHRDLIRSLLKTTGFSVEVEAVDDGMSALERVKAVKFDCIFLDYLLPDIPGLEMVEKLKKECPGVSLISITGYYNESLVKELARKGVVEILSKDKVSRERLAGILQRVSEGGVDERRRKQKPGQEFISFEDLEGMRVLVVDDVPVNLRIIQKIFEYQGLEILTAPGGEIALQIVQKGTVDLIFLDITMEGIDGFETCRKLKANEATRDIPVVFVTARVESEDYVQGLALGAVDYIRKPFNEHEILAKANTHLRLRKLVKEQEGNIKNLNVLVEEKAEELARSHEKLKRAYQQLELRVKESGSSLSVSEASLKAVVNYMVDGLIEIDEKGLVRAFNPAAEKLFGYFPDEVIGKNVRMLMPEPYAAEHDGYIEKYLSTGKAKIIGMGRDVEGKRKDGSTFPCFLSIGEIATESGRSFVGTLQDMTERKRTEEELLSAKEKAEKANHAKSEFLSSMSHELRTPLNAILGFSQLLEMDTKSPLDDNQRSNLKHITSSGNHLLNLINEILDLSMIESGHLSLSFENIDLAQLVEEIVQLTQPLAKKVEVSLVNDLDSAKGLYVFADRVRLKQVILNLISNAIKYNRRQGAVTLSVAESEDKM
ncbi:MAG: response regulator, partial [Nitrospinae bacterium]|nr:response regulator [Nitrospinota bacterium]